MDEHELNIRIGTTADTAGATKAEGALKGVTGSSKAAGTAARQLGEAYNEGAVAGRVLGEVARGNVLALGQLGSALRTVGTLLKTNLIGTLVTLGAVAASVLIPIIRGFNQAKEKIKETETSFRDTSAAARDLANAKFENLEEELKSLNAEANRSLNAFKLLLEVQGQLDESAAAADIAQVQADASLTDLEKVNQVAAIRARTRGAKRQRDDQLRREEERAAEARAQREASAADAAAVAAATQRARVDAIDEDRVDRAEEIRALEERLRKIPERVVRPSPLGAGGPTTNLNPEFVRVKDELERLRERQTVATSPEAKKAFETQQKILNDQVAAADEMRRAAETARAAFEAIAQRNQTLDEALPAIRANQDRAAIIGVNRERAAAAPPWQDMGPVRARIGAAQTERSRLAAIAYTQGDTPEIAAALAEQTRLEQAASAELVDAVKRNGQATIENQQALKKAVDLQERQQKNAR